MPSRLCTACLVALAAAPLLGFLPRVLGPRTPDPLDRRPTWAHLMVVTCDTTPEDLSQLGPGLTVLQRRGTRAKLRPPVDDDLAAAAASLWSGRRLTHPDLVATEGELPWSMACAARRTGAATAAFLERPLVSEGRLPGFEEVLEEPGLGPERMLRLLHAHLRANKQRRNVVWLHLADPGEHGEHLDALVRGLTIAILDGGQAWDTILLATPLGPGAQEELPLWAWLPSAMYAGRCGHGTGDATEIANIMVQLMRIPPPDVSDGETPVDGQTDLMVLLRGGTVATRVER